LRQGHAAPARAAGGVCRLERGSFLRRGEVGEIDHGEVLLVEGDVRHLGETVAEERHRAHHHDPHQQLRGSPLRPSFRTGLLFRALFHRTVILLRLAQTGNGIEGGPIAVCPLWY
jgi:hypothetical protein